MSATSDLPQLSSDQAWAQLEASPAAMLVCASSRQAGAYQRHYGQWQLARGRRVWATPAILSFEALLRQWYQLAEAQLRFGKSLPRLLSTAQSALLWRQCVEHSALPLLRGDEAAQLAAQAWQLAQEYRLTLPFAAQGHADIENFNRWAQRYRQQLTRLQAVDEAMLDALLLERAQAGELQLPSQCILAGFAELTPRLRQWRQTLAAQGVALAQLQLAPRQAQLQVEAAVDEEQELRAAAIWLREQAQRQPQAQLAVIVPDLSARRAQLQRVFDEQLCPAQDAPGTHAQPRPYNISLGQPLSAYGLVQTALRLLQLAAGGLEAGALSALLTSAYWGSAADAGSRAALDAELRRQGWLHIEAADWARLAPAPLQGYAQAAATLRAARRLPAGEWSERFAQLLQACAWPGPRALDSEEYQLLQRWRELLLEFSALDPVLGRVDLASALAQLRELAGREVFQPQSPASRLQVLGLLEAQGLSFDAIRVLSLDDEHWPAPARPHPFIPHALQRAAGLPHASAARELAYAQAQLVDWCRSAEVLVLSYAQRSEGREQAPSPLLLPWLDQVQPARSAALPPAWLASQASAQSESLDDSHAPPPGAQAVLRGGARVLGDQARCPFRAYAVHRLGAKPLETPAYGLQAYDRGELVHRVLERLWRQWRDQAGLLASDESQCRALIFQAVDQELAQLAQRAPQRLGSGLRQLELERLQALITQWLAVERARAPFRVLRIEDQAVTDEAEVEPVREFAGLKLRLRPDRIDTTPEGGRIVLDYKTGAARKPPWRDGRPEDPQLLLYALLEPQVQALGFARLNVEALGFEGLAADESQPGFAAYEEDAGTQEAESWNALLGRWRGELETLAEEIRRGWAAVQPKHPRVSCRDCGLHALCRIREVVSLDEGEAVAE